MNFGKPIVKPASRGGVSGVLGTLRRLGVSSLNSQLSFVATFSLISGLSQAGILIIISEFAVNSARGKDHLVIHGRTLSISDAILLCVILLVIYSISGIVAGFKTSSVSSSSLSSVRAKLIDEFFHAKWSQQSRERLGHLQQMLTFNCEKVGGITLGLAAGIQSLLTLCALILAAFLVSPLTAAVVLVFGVILSSVLRPFNTWGRRNSAKLSDHMHSLATLVTEYTRLVREFRLFGVEGEATSELRQGNQSTTRTYKRVQLLQQLAPVIYQTLAMAFIVAAFAVVAGRTVHNLGSIAAVVILMLRSLQYGASTQACIQMVRSQGGFLDAIEVDVARLSENQQALGAGITPSKFDVRVENVSFGYNERESILGRVSFYVPSGQILGIIGKSGSGKTTLGQIILGMLVPDEGFVLIGDVSPIDIAMKDRRSSVALVAQEPVLLQGTIESNVSFFRDLSEADVQDASRAAHLHEDVLLMPNGYATEVGEGGTALSGGQRQRLAIARALGGKPHLLVMDEPTSAVDSRSELLIRQTISELRGAVTSIIISHRYALVDDCDFILELDRGRVLEFGNRRDVLTRKIIELDQNE
jgi:ATP-binding cassette subfamily B protein